MTVDCHYINLPNAIERRATLEDNFAQCGRQGWELKRFNALDEATVKNNQVPGKRSWREKACFLSHRSVIEQQADDGRSFMVMEDDAQLGLASLEIIEGVLAQNHGAQWDLIFTDVSVREFQIMLALAVHRAHLMEERMVFPLDLAKIPFVGATAYVVNGTSRNKLLNCLADGVPVDTEYDVYLSNAILTGKLKAAALFPFVTTLSRHSKETQIQLGDTSTANKARDAFRRMMCLESSAESYSADLVAIENRLQGTQIHQVAMLAGALYFVD